MIEYSECAECGMHTPSFMQELHNPWCSLNPAMMERESMNQPKNLRAVVVLETRHEQNEKLRELVLKLLDAKNRASFGFALDVLTTRTDDAISILCELETFATTLEEK